MAGRCLLGLIGLLCCGQATPAEPRPEVHKYDVLARMFRPYGALFYSKSPTKALQAEVILQEVSGPAGALLHRPLRLSLQVPDRLRVETIGAGERRIFCRQGQRVWVYPSTLADRIIAAAGPPGPAMAIPDFHLPIPDNQIVLLPAFFQITSFQAVRDDENQAAWSLDFHPATELLQEAESPPWTVNAVVRQKDYQLRQLTVRSPEWSARLQILSTHFVNALPTELWNPSPAEAAGARDIPPALYSAALAKLPTINFEP